ncbi:Isochorismatase, partial [Bacillus paranthracis]|nr:Isochorismatase [Bacillus paranthracis]
EQGRDQLIICGIYAHIGCLLTACEAFMDGIQPFFVADAVADFSLEHHKQALEYASNRCAVTTSTNSLLTELQGLKDDDEITLQKVHELVAQLLREPVESVGTDEDLLNRGLDSVRIMSLVEKWRREGKEITFADLAENPTVVDWHRLLSLQTERVL